MSAPLGQNDGIGIGHLLTVRLVNLDLADIVAGVKFGRAIGLGVSRRVQYID